MKPNHLAALTQFIKKKKFNEALTLAKGEDLINQYIELLSTNRDYKKALKIIRNEKLDYKLYPKLIERAQKNYVRYLIKNFDWVKIYFYKNCRFLVVFLI